jgi:hypothetical protein
MKDQLRKDIPENINSILGEGPGAVSWRSVPLKTGEKPYWFAASRIHKKNDEIYEAVIVLNNSEGFPGRLYGIEKALISGRLKNADDILDSVRDSVAEKDDSRGSAAVKKYMAGWVCADVIGRCLNSAGSEYLAQE